MSNKRQYSFSLEINTIQCILVLKNNFVIVKNRRFPDDHPKGFRKCDYKNEKDDVLTSTQKIIQQAIEKLGYSEEMYELLKEPLRMLTVKIPVRMDDGKVKVFTGYRAQHNDAVGPTKGNPLSP